MTMKRHLFLLNHTSTKAWLATLLTLALMSGTAEAQVSFQDSGSGHLQPTPESDEPAAAGRASLKGIVDLLPCGWSTFSWAAWFSGTLAVDCRGLTPLAVYRINETEYVTADPNGRVAVVRPFFAMGSGTIYGRRASAVFGIWIQRQVTLDDGTVTYVGVLQGAIGLKK